MIASRQARILLAALALSLSGCGGAGRRPGHFRVKGDLRVQVQVDRFLNDLNPVPVDLLLIYDKELVEPVMALTAADWFARREQFLRDHVEGEEFTLHSWEWVPAQPVPEQRIPGRAGAVAGFVFARYRAPGAHRQRFDGKSDILILLEPDRFQVRRRR